MRIFILFIISFPLVLKLSANKYDCIIAAKKYEKKFNIPDNLLVSVALTESGRKLNEKEFIAWPWTINRN